MPVLYMDRASIESLTEADIRKIIEENSTDLKYGTLHDYYVGQHRILNEEKKYSTDPNNRIVSNMAKYITDIATGYFMGNPVVYDSPDKEYLQLVQKIFKRNHEQDQNAELEKQCSICGNCFEMLYLDENAQIRFARIPSSNGIMICETDSGFSTPMAFIRTILSVDKSGNQLRKVEFWDSRMVLHFYSVNGGYLSMTGTEEHYWQDVPFVEYINNEERLGDFEGIITENDAYNKAQSNTANYFQYNDDAILKISKLGDVRNKDVKDLREKRVIVLEDGGDVQWLLKTIDDTAMENYKNRLKEDIHMMSNVPNMCDTFFGGNLSGIAIAYKLWCLDQMCGIKERKFKKGLERRIKLITNVLNIMGHHFDYRDITLKFRRNRPQNDMETAQIVTMLANDLSRETRLQLMPGVEDVQEELRKLEKEKSKEQEDFGLYRNLAKAFQGSGTAGTGGTEAVTDGTDGAE